MSSIIEQLLEDWNPKHTEFQCDHFITEKNGITIWGMYRQALREFCSRLNTVRDAIADIALLDLDIEELREKNGRRSEIELWRETNRSQLLKKKLRRSLDELKRFFVQAKTLRRQLSNPNDPRHEEEFWFYKIRLEAGYRALSGQRIGSDLYQSAKALPKKIADHLIESFGDPGGLALYAKSFEPPSLRSLKLYPEPTDQLFLEFLSVPYDYCRIDGCSDTKVSPTIDSLEVDTEVRTKSPSIH